VWRDGTLKTSINFRNSRTLANGPLRVMFELIYEPWDTGAGAVREVKRITLDAGHRLNRFELTFTPAPAPGASLGLGIKINPKSVSHVNREAGVLSSWEPLQQDGFLGCGVIAAGGTFIESRTAEGNYLVLASLPEHGAAVYYAGSAWDRAGAITTAEAWDAYLAREARRLRTPVVVTTESM
jgi:hypothetical protein